MPICLGYCENKHCLKSARIWRFSGLYSVWIRENMDQKTPNTDTLHAVIVPNHFIILPWVKVVEDRLIWLLATLLDLCYHNQIITKITFYFNEMKSFLKAVLLVYNRLIEKLSMLTFKSKFIINGTCLYPFFKFFL